MLSRHDYLPFGEEITMLGGGRTTSSGRYEAADDTRQKFTSKERDSESSLDYFGGRYFDGREGRFTSTDPSRVVLLTDPRTWNRYAYCVNDPFGHVDVNGEWPPKIHDLIIDRAFPGLTESERAAIKDGSARVDDVLNFGQSAELAYQHAMRAPGQSVQEASEKARGFIQDEERQARRLQSYSTSHGMTDLQGDSLFEFGRELHTITDATSPAHEGFQVWPGILSPIPADISYEFGHERRESTIDSYRLGLAVGASLKAFADTYGDAALARATGELRLEATKIPA